MPEKIVIQPSDLDRITITEADLPYRAEPVYHEAFKFYVGEPRSDAASGNMYTIPDIPHMHDAIVEITNSEGTKERLEGLKRVLVAHGIRDKNGHWTFKDGRQVKFFVDEYNANNPNTPIDVAAVCNPTDQYHASTIHGVSSLVGVSGYGEGLGGMQTVVSINVLDPRNGYFYRPESPKRKHAKRSLARAARRLFNKR